MTTAPSGLSPEMAAHIGRLTEVQRLASSGWISRAILAAVELGVPEALAPGPRPVADIAAEVGADPIALNRLLRGLTSLGLIDLTVAGEYELTALGQFLRGDARDSMRDSVLLMGGAQRAWSQLTECVRTGDHAVKLLDGIEDPFEAFSPEARAVFDEAMVAGTRLIAGAVALAYDFAGVRSIVDVGGGHGALLPPILRSNPAMTGTVFDLPTCRDGALRVFEKTKIADRCEFVAGDFFDDALPAGADAYVLKSILHDWGDERCLAILRACRAAMREASRLLIIELIVAERPGSSDEDQAVVQADLNMLVATGGRERTAPEYGELLEAAGFRLSRIVPTLSLLSVTEAQPVTS
jgi:hypothetical protein